MPNSLKSCLPVLGRILNETPDALYARQRAFVRTGLLKSVPGRGPGSGVHASAETFALFLIGMLTNASVAENGPIAKSIANAASPNACPLTGAKTFRGALAAVRSDEQLSKRVNEVDVQVGAGLAIIRFDGSSSDVPLPGLAKPMRVTRNSADSTFMGKRTYEGRLQIGVSIAAETIHELTAATVGFLADTERS
jgi:hypothetical protein